MNNKIYGTQTVPGVRARVKTNGKQQNTHTYIQVTNSTENKTV